MLSREDKFYIEILKDFVHGNKTKEVEDINWDVIVNYAKTQNTNGIVFYQCKEFIPQDYFKPLFNLYASEIYAYGTRISLTEQITQLLTKQNIPYFIIKGPIVSAYYPVPALRTMGDTDIVVHEKDMDDTCQIMKKLGYEQIKSEHELAFFRDGKEVEIHSHLIYPSKNRKIEETILCDRCWDYVKDDKLDDTFHFMYLLLHLKKHLFGIGVGMRHFLDLAILLNKTNVDFDFIDKEFKKIDLVDYKNTCLSMIAKWFDVGQDIVGISDEFYNDETEKILRNGVHGHENDDNKLNSAFKRMSGKDNKLSSFNRINYLREIFFPDYESMMKIDKYQFIKDKKYLLPIAWIYRFILSLVDNKAIKQIKETIDSVFLSKKIMDKKQKSRDNWGL